DHADAVARASHLHAVAARDVALPAAGDAVDLDPRRELDAVTPAVRGDDRAGFGHRSKSASSFAAQMKSFSESPPIACVLYATRQVLKPTVMSGWWSSRCEIQAAAFTKATAW